MSQRDRYDVLRDREPVGQTHNYDALRDTQHDVDAERLKRYAERSDALEARANQQPAQAAERPQGINSQKIQQEGLRDPVEAYVQDLPARVAALKEKGITGAEARNRIDREDQGTYIEPPKPSPYAGRGYDQRLQRAVAAEVGRVVDGAADRAVARAEERARALEQRREQEGDRSQEREKSEFER